MSQPVPNVTKPLEPVDAMPTGVQIESTADPTNGPPPDTFPSPALTNFQATVKAPARADRLLSPPAYEHTFV